MHASLLPYFLAIGANLAFGTASIVFAKYTRLYSPLWMNQLKVAVALVGFTAAFFFLEQWAALSWTAAGLLAGSGFLGLCVGDYFLFRAFSELGPTRTLVLYSFQPFMLGIYGYFFLGQTLSVLQFFAILCMIACVSVFVLERNRLTGKWHFLSFIIAFLGIFFDAVGVMLSRSAFEATPALGSFQANGIRAFGALAGFILFSPRGYAKLYSQFTLLPHRRKTEVLTACFFGTFVSLALYLTALKSAHVAILTSIAITGPVWVSMIEHVQKKELPNRYLICALGFFLTGFLLLTLNSLH